MELNKKLAEWRWGRENLTISEDGKFIYYHTTWNKVDEEWNIEPVPNFPQSLDACFKWLWNKAIKMLADTEREGCEKLLGLWLEEPGPALTPLALCLAVEKLIDSEVRNEMP